MERKAIFLPSLVPVKISKRCQYAKIALQESEIYKKTAFQCFKLKELIFTRYDISVLYIVIVSSFWQKKLTSYLMTIYLVAPQVHFALYAQRLMQLNGLNVFFKRKSSLIKYMRKSRF